MPSSSLFLRSSATLVSVLSLLTAPVNTYSSDTYALDTTYAGDNFFDGFDFYTEADKSHGFVTYVDESTAKTNGLIKSGTDGSVIIGVDSNHTYDSTQDYWLINGVGRPSVRITSTTKYNHGLFIADIAHMPGGVCGTWPGFWTLGDGTWPYHGEIDILEGANDQLTQLSALHTAGECSIAGDSRTETGSFQASNCTYDVNTGENGAGCGVSSIDSSSYGLNFNTNKGGVYAMQWTSDYIKIWFWPRGSIPKDIQAGAPTPDSWGLPTSNFQGDCDLDSNFINQQIVLDVTFCGDWAGNTWENSCAAKTGVSSCAAYVGDNPSAFVDMFWDINSIKVYQLTPPSSNSSATSTSTTTSTTTPTTAPTTTPTTVPTTTPTTAPTTTPTITPTTTPSATNSSGCPAWTDGCAPPAYLTNLPSTIQAELPAWTGTPPAGWCSYTSWMKSYTSANSVYASCSAKAANNSSYYACATPTSNSTTPTGSSATPTGNSSTPTGSSGTPTGNSTTPTGSSVTPTSTIGTATGNYTTATTGTSSTATVTGSTWSNWGNDPTGVTYAGSSTTAFPLTTGWAYSSIAAPPMGGDGSHAGTISADGNVWSWGSATSTDPAAKTTATSKTTSWDSWSDPSSTSSTTTTTTTWGSWTASSATTTVSTSKSTYTKTSWTYNPASRSVYWALAGSSLSSTLSTLSSTTSVAYAAVATSASTSSAAWDPVDPTTTGPHVATFTGAASSVGVSAMVAYVAVGFTGLLVLVL